MNKIHFLFFFILILQQNTFSQTRYTDSLITGLKKHNDQKLKMGKDVSPLYDTTATFILNDLAYYYANYDFVKAIDYAKQAFALSAQIGFNRGVGTAYNNMGLANYYKGDYVAAKDLAEKALKIFEGPGGSKKGIALSQNSLGLIYEIENNYEDALKHIYASLAINEQIGNKWLQSQNLRTIGDIEWAMLNRPEALKNYLEACKVSEESGDKISTASIKSQIGRLYTEQENYPEALKCQFEALKLLEEADAQLNIPYTYNFIGEIYMKQGNYAEALKYQ